ncbi:maleylpyruvate isomerase family mycothiol-dependent enzyme [Actinomadura syzygii]|uniref:Maleylpyruvate isomerase family mycothiol-dependent enzyme n=1 Tax=Actinomadura syzygii TaxID=1427538 RepID=A0A5D0UIF8_9ACTN|nr:maleylpyruvate isomerase family mycothiol-dependent enzyme [Actinomadura syzygii]TYC17383.1 maleylpyruvate isomerase family mycothiol-dependent enzyme [Actinomadura syzygii]
MRTIIAAYEQTVRSSLELASTLDGRDWDLPTECPGWTVKDQFSHLAGVELALLGDPSPDVEVPEFEHVRNDFGKFMELAVHARRPVPGPDVAAHLAGALERRLAELPGIDPERVVMCPDGREGPYTRFMKFRAMDCWTHEQDVRRAVGRPGNLDAPAARCFWELMSPGLPRVVARKASAEPGRSVAFRISGPPSYDVAVRVDDDGRGHLAEPADAGADPAAELGMDWETYVRLTAGRCAPGAVTVTVKGDRELASRVLTAMAMTP